MPSSPSSSVDDRRRSEPVYFAYSESLIDGQDDRKESIEKRGLSVITTSGTIVTLLLGLVTILSKADGFTLVKQARGPLYVSIVLFATAAVLGLATNLPLPWYGNVDDDAIVKQLNRKPVEPAENAQLRIALANMEIFKRARRMNGIKARVLIWAMAVEVSGAVALAIAVGEVLLHSGSKT